MVRNSRRRDGRYVRAEVVGPSSLRGGRRRGGRVFFFSSSRRHTRYWPDWSSDVCSSDLPRVLLSLRLPSRTADGFCRVPQLRWDRTALAGAALQSSGDLGHMPALETGALELVLAQLEIGRASCRERVRISVGAVYLKKKT